MELHKYEVCKRFCPAYQEQMQQAGASQIEGGEGSLVRSRGHGRMGSDTGHAFVGPFPRDLLRAWALALLSTPWALFKGLGPGPLKNTPGPS